MHTVQPNAVFQFVSISQKYAIENHFPRIPRFSAFFNQSDIPDRTAHGRDAAICASAGYAVCPSGFSRKEHAGQPRPSCCGGGIGAFTLDLRHRVHPILLYYSKSPFTKLRPRPQSNRTYITWSVMQPASCRFTSKSMNTRAKRRRVKGLLQKRKILQQPSFSV